MFSLIRIAASLPVFATIQKKDHNFFAYKFQSQFSITVSKSYNNFIAMAKELSAVFNWNVFLFHRWLGRRMNQNYWIYKKIVCEVISLISIQAFFFLWSSLKLLTINLYSSVRNAKHSPFNSSRGINYIITYCRKVVTVKAIAIHFLHVKHEINWKK